MPVKGLELKDSNVYTLIYELYVIKYINHESITKTLSSHWNTLVDS